MIVRHIGASARVPGGAGCYPNPQIEPRRAKESITHEDKSPQVGSEHGDPMRMTDVVDFTDKLWLFASPWCDEKLEDLRHTDAIALAWVALWNYTIDSTSMTENRLCRVCEGVFDIPTNELIDLLIKRRAVFFPDDNRLIERYRLVLGEEDFTILVKFVE